MLSRKKSQLYFRRLNLPYQRCLAIFLFEQLFAVCIPYPPGVASPQFDRSGVARLIERAVSVADNGRIYRSFRTTVKCCTSPTLILKGSLPASWSRCRKPQRPSLKVHAPHASQTVDAYRSGMPIPSHKCQPQGPHNWTVI